MSADTNSDHAKPNDEKPGTGTRTGTGTADDRQPGSEQTGDETTATASGHDASPSDAKPEGPKAYVDPSIAAEAKIAELENQLTEMRDRYLRTYAENENLRKRTEREKADTAKYAVTGFARDMVAVADNLRRAIDAASASATTEGEPSGALKALLDGVVLTDQELQKALEKHGVRPITAKGELFDPHKHQAVMEQDDATVPAGTILQSFQDGYMIEDRVLRPSMVVVAKGGAKAVKSSEAAPNIAGVGTAPADAANDAEPAASDMPDDDQPQTGESAAKPDEPGGAN